MIDKKEFLLHSIIQAYIKHLEPIGSSQLKSMYDISYSPATIRGYFKKLGDEGYLAQEHISSGRTPTIEALKEYWAKRLNLKLDNIDKKALEYFSKEIGVSVFLKKERNDVLEGIENIKDKNMLLIFSDIVITVKFTNALYRFMSDMIGLTLNDILKVSKEVGAYDVYESLIMEIQNKDYEIFNYKDFLALVSKYNYDEDTIKAFLKGTILDRMSDGLYFENVFPDGFMGVCHYCKVDGEDVKMLVVGELAKDYEYFYKKINLI